MYMIEIILLNQSKRPLLDVIRQIPLTCAVSCELCLIISTILLLLQQIIMQYDVCKVLCAYKTRCGKTVEDVPLSFKEILQIRQT